MRRIDFHRSADTKPWIASGRSWATRTRSSSSTTTTPSVVFGVCGPTRGPVGARLPHRLTALHRLLQRRAASRRRWPAHPGRQPAWWQETAPDPPPPCHLVGLAAAKVEGARHACPAARPPGAAPPPAAGRWQAASRRPGGPPPPRCLAEVVPRTHPRIPVDQQPGSQKRRPPAAQEPTGPGQALAGQLVLPAGTFALSRKAWAEPSKVEALPRRRRQRST